MALLTPVLLSLMPFFGWGASDVFSSVTAKRVGPMQTSFIFQSLELLLLFVFILLFWHPFAVAYLPVLILYGAVGALLWPLFLYAAKVGDISVVSPICSTSVVVSSVLGLIFLHEHLTVFKLASLCMVLIGIMLLSVVPGELKAKKLRSLYAGVPPALLFAVLFGAYLFLAAPLSRQVGWYDLALSNRLVTVMVLLAILLAGRLPLPLAVSRQTWGLLLANAVVDLTAFCTFSIAVTRYAVSYVSIISLSFPVVTVLLAAKFLKERLTGLQIAGICFVILSIGILQF